METCSYSYLTVSYAKDLAGVMRLRESLRRVGDDAQHQVVVHTEDLDAFRRALVGDRQVILRATEEVLPGIQERARRLRVRRDPAAKWIARALRLFAGPEVRRSLQVRGWHYQQISKFYATKDAPTECVVILDSDLVALSRPRSDHFMAGGRCLLYAQKEKCLDPVGYGRWLRETQDCLGVSRETAGDMNFVFGPVVWSRSVVRSMFEEFGSQAGGSLAYYFLRSRLNSEYYLYGLYSTISSAACARLQPTGEIPSIMIGLADQIEQIGDILRREWDPDRRPFLWVQGYLDIPTECISASIEATSKEFMR